MFTANTMASVIEVMGMSLPCSSSNPATSADKVAECRRAGAAIRVLLERDLRPSHILTREAFENAITLAIAIGGSTNVVLHLLAIARALEIDLTVDDFQRISDRTPPTPWPPSSTSCTRASGLAKKRESSSRRAAGTTTASASRRNSAKWPTRKSGGPASGCVN